MVWRHEEGRHEAVVWYGDMRQCICETYVVTIFSHRAFISSATQSTPTSKSLVVTICHQVLSVNH